MTRRVPSFALVLALVLGALLPATAGAADLPVPSSMAAVGDSITQAASTGGGLGVDAPQNSWSTGTSATVNSHFLRLRALNPQIAAFNRSVSGAKVADLNAQMQTVAALDPDPGYLTVLIGGNDLCTDTVAQMTSVADFRARFATAMDTITSQSPGTAVYVVSVPDAYQLWNLFKNNFFARFVWATAGICQSLLANPTSTQQADVARRAAVRQRNIEFNAQLAEVCALYVQCRFDGNAAFNTAFTTGDVSGDYFHPSVAGQAKLASVSWAAGYTWATAPPPPPNAPPTAAFTSACNGLSCTFTDASTDTDGTVQARSWAFGDGGSSTATNPTYPYPGPGTYSVTLTVTDDDGGTDADTQSVSVTAPPPTPMWVSGLAGSATPSRTAWTARVEITVTDGAPVSGVVVTGTWSAGSGSGSCTTSSAGTCVVTASLNKKATGTKFSVADLQLAGWLYQPSSITEVTVSRP